MLSEMEQFIRSEMHVWGTEYIEDLINRGFTPVEVSDGNGNTKWTWVHSPNVLVAH